MKLLLRHGIYISVFTVSKYLVGGIVPKTRSEAKITRSEAVVLAAVNGSLGLPGWRLFRSFTLLSPFSHSSPSLIGLLASVDVKQKTKQTKTALYAEAIELQDRRSKRTRQKKTRQKIGKGNQMTALRFQTGGRHQTSPASLSGRETQRDST